MQLVDNWKDIALRAHSMIAQYLGLGALVAPDAILLVLERDTDPRMWFWTGLVLLIYGMVGRLVQQGIGPTDRTTLRSPLLVAVIALALLLGLGSQKSPVAPDGPYIEAQATSISQHDADFIAIAFPLIAKWEGLRLEAYRDIVGVWTVCYGETKGVRPGDRYTAEECAAMLRAEIFDYRDRLRPSFTDDTVAHRLPPARDAAFSSVAYNVGVGAFGKSTAVRRLNAGDIVGACQAITWWNKAGNRVIRGLVNRRAEEQALCLGPLA